MIAVRDIRRLIAAVFLLVVAANSASAQSYPNRPVRIVVSNPAGGTSDLLARIVARGLQARFNQSFVVENRPGASGLLSTEATVKAPADGYTLLVANEQPITILPSFRRDLPFDPEVALAPITMLASMPFFVVARADLGANSIADLVRIAKAKPGALNYGSTGQASASELATELFNSVAGIKMVHIPYQGGPKALMSVLSGESDVFLSVPTTALPQIGSEKLKFLGITSRQRNAKAPNIPTLMEQGFANFETGSWFGMLAPSGIPRDTLDLLQRETVALMRGPEAQKLADVQGANLILNTPAEFAAAIREDVAKWKKLASTLNLKM